MQIEIQGIPQSLKAQYTTRLKNAQSDLARYKKLSREAHSQASRTDLLSGAGSGGGGGFWGSKGRVSSDEPYGDDRTRLLAGTEVLDDGNRWVFINCPSCHWVFAWRRCRDYVSDCIAEPAHRSLAIHAPVTLVSQ